MRLKLCFTVTAVWLLLPLFCMGQNEKWNAEGHLFLCQYGQVSTAKSPDAAKTRARLEETACGGTLRVLVMNGQEVLQKRCSAAGTVLLNVSRLTPGMYLLYFEGTDGNKSFGKMIKK